MAKRAPSSASESSAARRRAEDRQGFANALLAGEALDLHCRLEAEASRFLQGAATRLGWSARGFHRVLRVARTIADLAVSRDIAATHLAEAIQFRRALQTQ